MNFLGNGTTRKVNHSKSRSKTPNKKLDLTTKSICFEDEGCAEKIPISTSNMKRIKSALKSS